MVSVFAIFYEREVFFIKKIDYAKKSELLSSGLVELQAKIERSIFVDGYNSVHDTDFKASYDLETAFQLRSYFVSEDMELWKECERINHAATKRALRLRERIEYFLSLGHCFFVTLTFNDSCLSSTTEETRRAYVKRFLRSQSSNYVANIDYGSENGREHYHCVIVCDNVDLSSWEKYGFIFYEHIKRPKSSIKLGKYISKLTNHAIKETCKRQAIIYSR